MSYAVAVLEELDDESALAELVRVVKGGNPVVAHLYWNGLHAVVVVEVDATANLVYVMNPASGQNGRIVELSAKEFLQRWFTLGYGGFYFEE